MVESLAVNARLLYVAEDESAFPAFVVGAPVHEVEGDVERSEVGIVRVVDEGTAVPAFLYFKTHGDRLKRSHTGSQLFGRDAEV